MAKKRKTTDGERSDRFQHNLLIAEAYNERLVSRENIRYYRKIINHPAFGIDRRIAIRHLLDAEWERYNYACNLCTLDYIGVRKGSWEEEILNTRRKHHTVSTFKGGI